LIFVITRAFSALFGPGGVFRAGHVEINPELCVRLASAYATTLKRGVGA